MIINVIWVLHLFFIQHVFSLRILAVFPHEGKSHLMVFQPVIRTLLDKNHEVTVITRHSLNIQSNNIVEVLIEGKTEGINDFSLGMFDKSGTVLFFGSSFVLTSIGIDACCTMLSNDKVQNLMLSNEKFDLIIAEMFNSDCYLTLVDKFEAPVVGLSSTTLMQWHTDRLGQPNNPSYIKNNHVWSEAKMNFFNRVENLIGNLWYDLVHWYQVQYYQYLAEKYFGRKMNSFYKLMMNTSLILVNSHFSLHSSVPLVPGIVEIGGVHISTPKRLPAVSSY